MLQVITTSRIVQVFIIFLGGGTFFLILSFLIIRKSKNRLNLTICGFFIFIFLGGLFNAIYVLLTTHTNEATVVKLHIFGKSQCHQEQIGLLQELLEMGQ